MSWIGWYWTLMFVCNVNNVVLTLWSAAVGGCGEIDHQFFTADKVSINRLMALPGYWCSQTKAFLLHLNSSYSVVYIISTYTDTQSILSLPHSHTHIKKHFKRPLMQWYESWRTPIFIITSGSHCQNHLG